MTDLTPTQWFDQFPGLKEGITWPADSQWCPRHWAPCPALGANGMGAAVELTQIWISELRPKGSYSAAAMNRHMAKVKPICCTLGDDRMYELWSHWPPVKPSEASDG